MAILQDLDNAICVTDVIIAIKSGCEYAILGLLPAFQNHGKLPVLLQPDYTKSTGNVFRDTTRYHIEVQRNLAVLMYVDYRFDSEISQSDQRSWVLHWDRPYASGYDPFPFARGFNVCGQSDEVPDAGEEIIPSQDLNVLTIRGSPVSPVVHTRNIFMDSYRRTLNVPKSELLNMAASMCIPLHALAWTLIAGSRIEHPVAAESEPAEFNAFCDWMALEGRQRAEIQCSDRLDISVTKPEADQRFENAVLRACFGRRVFMTANNRVGVGPTTMDTDDIIVVLYGCTLPVVLRPHSAGWYFVGTCYVHGIMFGEAVAKHRESGEQDERFQIS